MTEEKLDECIKLAVAQYCEEEFISMENQMKKEPSPSFSEEFERKIELLRQKQSGKKESRKKEHQKGNLKRGTIRLRYVFLAILLLILGVSSVMAVEPVREKIGEMFYTVFSNNITIEGTGGKSTDKEVDSVICWKKPTYIPDGYELEESECDEIAKNMFLLWINEEGEAIEYMQCLLENINIALSSDGKKPRNIMVGKKNAQIVGDQNGLQTILYEENGWFYSVSGMLSDKELIKIINSIE